MSRDDVSELVVFDITDPCFYAGRISSEFERLSDDGNAPWFFQPSSWAPNGDGEWFGSLAHSLSRILMSYSSGHRTKEAAQEAADEWLLTLKDRRNSECASDRMLWSA
jgi:hypothetical protein